MENQNLQLPVIRYWYTAADPILETGDYGSVGQKLWLGIPTELGRLFSEYMWVILTVRTSRNEASQEQSGSGERIRNQDASYR